MCSWQSLDEIGRSESVAREFSYVAAPGASSRPEFARDSCGLDAVSGDIVAAVRRLFIASLAAVTMASAATGRAQAACDRQCLTDILTRYLNGMVSHDPAGAPLSPAVRFTENAATLKVGEGLWKNLVKLRSYRLDVIDPQQGVATVHAVLEEGGVPILFAGRLKVVDRTITEVETLVAHSQADAMLFAPASLTMPSSEMTYTPQASERMPREQMVAIASRYPAGLRAGSFVTADAPFAPNAYRFENGVRMAGPGCTFQPPSCENMRAQRIPTLPDVKQRVLAVDEE
jgi:hypothetical protein